MKVMLGKRPPKFDSRTLMFGAYVTAKLPAPPAAVDYSKKVHKWPMYGNDRLGDCTCAAAGHMIQEWTANTGKIKTISEKAVETAYDYFSGGNPDAGANMLDVLNYWRHTGIGGNKINAFVGLEPRNVVQAKDSVKIFGTCYIGVALPDFAVNPNEDFLKIPWVVPPQGPVGNAKPNLKNGHCIPAVGYDTRNLYVVTWGAVKAMSWEFYKAYMDEAYAVLSPDWAKKAPNGFDLKTLQADLAAIKKVSAAKASGAAA